eukprot:gene18693-20581_t
MENLLKLTNLSMAMNSAVNSTSHPSPAMEGAVNQEVETLYTLMYVFAGLMILPGIFGNGLIVLLVTKQHKLKTPTNYLIVSLAIADLLMIVGMLVFLLMDRFPVQSIPLKVIVFLFPSIDILVGSASILSLAAVSLDRGIAVLRPLSYHNLINTARVKIVIFAIWAYSILLFIFSMLRIKIESQAYRMSVLFAAMVGSFVIPCFLIMTSYFGILLSTVHSIRITKALEKAISMATSKGEETLTDKATRKRRMRSRELRLAMNIMIILIPFVVGWGFYFGTHWYEMVNRDTKRSNVYEFCMIIIPWLNSSINPVIYVCLTKSLRKGCRRLLCKRRDPLRRESSLTTAIFSSFNSRRPSWLERSISSLNGEASSKKARNAGGNAMAESKRGSVKKHSYVITLMPSAEEQYEGEENV